MTPQSPATIYKPVRPRAKGKAAQQTGFPIEAPLSTGRGRRPGQRRECADASGGAERAIVYPPISELDPYANLSEHQIQSALFRAYDVRGIGGSVMMFSIPNGGSRGDTPEDRAISGRIMKREGCKAGAPDICAIVEGAVYFIEVKTMHGTLSTAQKEFHAKARAAGAYVYVVYGFLQAVTLLEDIGVLRRPIRRGDGETV